MRSRSLPVALVALLTAGAFAQRQDFSSLVTQPEPAPEAATAFIPDRWIGPGPIHKLVVNDADQGVLAYLHGTGGVVAREVYESFQVVMVDTRVGGALPDEVALLVHDELDLLSLNGLLVNGSNPHPALANLAAAETFGVPGSPLDPAAGLYIVQFRGPIRDTWVRLLQDLGISFLQYVPMNAYVVQLRAEHVGWLEALPGVVPAVQWVAPWHPAFRMTPAVRAAALETQTTWRPITVQVVNGTGAREALSLLRAASAGGFDVTPVGPYLNVKITVESHRLSDIARLPVVFAVEERGVRRRLDEAQGQIVAGNITGTAPTGPGYLAWLAGRGFDGTQFGTFAVNVVDDATSLTGHADLATGRVAFSINPTSQGGAQGGHGFLNAHIVAGFNNGVGATFEDSFGFNYGLGIAPWARVGSTAIFGAGSSSPTSWENTAWTSSARISSNSWSFTTSGGAPIPDYDSNSQEYDFIVRDAQASVSGLQELAVTFAAGNDGSGSNTVSTPSTAKNIITVGASENWRQTGTDGCGITNTGANNVDDIISFSSRGPVNSAGGDGRFKPEIMAPGTHVEAGVPQSNYNGSSVCNQYFPAGQTLYGWSSGTSHSTPAVAGGMALLRQHFLNQALGTPSPAMIKAFLMNSATYMNGVGAGGSLPSNSQGMGRMDLGRAFDATSRVLVDQTQVLAASGANYVASLNVADPGTPLRVTLVWTDAPGPTTGAPWVNNLNLTVSVGGATYLGNVFSGASSTTGGTADIRNNAESVFLPAGQSGAVTVTVTAATIGGDGVPGNGDLTDQDFALVVYNATTGGPAAPTAEFIGSPTSGTAPLNVVFTDQSTGTISTRSWNFGDGGSSTAQNPTHIYATAGTYTVSLTVTGPGGSNVRTRTNYISVTSGGGGSGLSDGSFESQTAGAAPVAPWSVVFGAGHVINPAGGASSDNGFPSGGAKWCEISGESTNNATPPSNPFGFGNLPIGGAGVSQMFSYAAGQTVLRFDAAFLRNESANSTYNDWMSIDVTDGATAANLFYADTFTATPLTSSKYGLPMTALSSIAANLAVVFPSSSSATVFTLSIVTGNGSDGVQGSRGYADNLRLEAPAAAPTADFSGTPVSGQAPLAVNFTNLSTGSVTSYSWQFGDGATSSAQNPNHTYTAAGTYTVQLTVTGPGGSDAEVKSGYVTVSAPPSSGDLIYMSFTSDTSVPGVGTVADEDIVSYNSGTGTWSLVFDGSDVGLAGTDVNAFCVLPSGQIAMSFDAATFSVPGLSGGPSGTSVNDEDIVLFTPTSLGSTTAGSFSFYFDGSDVGLTTSSEDIDGLHIDAAGNIYISTLGNPGVTGLSGLGDEDVLRFVPTSLGSSTAGTWSLFFDGSDLGLTENGEDLASVTFDGAGRLLLSPAGTFTAGGVTAAGEDLIRFSGTYGSATSGTLSLLLDLSTLGISTAEDVDGLHWVSGS